MKQRTNIALFISSFVILLSLSPHFNLCAASKSESDGLPSFAYKLGSDGEPAKWGKLHRQWQVCETGKTQSPINLSPNGVQVVHNPGLLETRYKPAHAVLKNRGHDIMVWWKEDAGKIVIDGTEYKLKQCHWHAPSEHTINGTRFAAELHMVHENDEGKTAVVGALYKYGQPNPFLSQFLEDIKAIQDKEIDEGRVDPRDIKLDARMFYRYIGSLTVPPCTEGVVWTVINKVGSVSREQVQALSKAVHHGFEENSRPVQKLNGRPVWFYAP